MTPRSRASLTKDELIEMVLALVGQVTTLQAGVAALEARQNSPPKTPDNSSLPPSKGQKVDAPTPAKKQRRKGRPGVARKLADNPDHVREIFAERCDGCGKRAKPADQPHGHAFDHIDLPPIKPIVTRLNLHSGACACCGKPIAARAPGDMSAGSPFGPGIIALVLDLRTRHIVSFNRLSVVYRRVTNGLRPVWGSAVYADIVSVIATGALHGITALEAIRTCLAGRSVLDTS